MHNTAVIAQHQNILALPQYRLTLEPSLQMICFSLGLIRWIATDVPEGMTVQSTKIDMDVFYTPRAYTLRKV